ncbi:MULTISPECIES: hypothetical protein [unclassified Mesorhizobium]|uniref:hypothetical protein n=1 Tax=unclassified Mesorhizobium TaxID=325217 RepID=UPI001093CFF3|nr:MULTISPECIES: hypothetical protein [unclassified Mesorhizobium]TGT91317.1 hypothetical protein EN804_08385 [Mesorhizobium sp. M8A.F.Ca.ET.161.01.1.1]TGV43405.1 hypothetical protein EN785_05165 [Mesorhizobium sp. M8A.F.Ca.ET.142.01.1.1]TGW06755.1 hypothetical protein EN788_40460 [Mesorhizobium sp. M2D.F.Ca.ET.145.01.1.1]
MTLLEPRYEPIPWPKIIRLLVATFLGLAVTAELLQVVGRPVIDCSYGFVLRKQLAMNAAADPGVNVVAIDAGLHTTPGLENDLALPENRSARATAKRVSTNDAIAFAYTTVTPLSFGF